MCNMQNMLFNMCQHSLDTTTRKRACRTEVFKPGHGVKKRGQLGQYKNRWYLITKDRHNGGENSAAGLLVVETVLVLGGGTKANNQSRVTVNREIN